MRQRRDDNDHKIYTYMARMSSDDERKNEEYGDSLQLTNWILDSEATCHMMPEVTDFIPGLLEDTDKFIEVADGHHIMAKQKGSVRIKMCDDATQTCNRYETFTVTFTCFIFSLCCTESYDTC